MTDLAHGATREWLEDQLRYPQRLPRTCVVVNWSSVPESVQRRLDESAHVSGSIDYIELPRRRWWRSLRRGLSADEVHVIESAATTLQWPANFDNDETRLLALVEGIVDRIATHPAWQHPVASGHRSVVALHIELHDFAATTHELLQLRCATPEVSAHADSYVRQEWERRQVAFAHSRAALIDRAVALRLVEETLDRVGRLAEDQRAVQQFAAQADAVNNLYQRSAGADFAAATATITTNELEAVAENLRTQLAFLSEVQR